MIGYLRGTLLVQDGDYLIVEANGVGYEVNATAQAMAGLPAVGETAQLFIYTLVREDELSLFGFSSRSERQMFELLMKVSGVGQRLALLAVSQMGEEGLIEALITGNHLAFTKVKGIGKRTAERIVLELKDKTAKTYSGSMAISGGVPVRMGGNLLTVQSAMEGLGFKPAQIVSVLQGIKNHKELTVDELLREALNRITP